MVTENIMFVCTVTELGPHVIFHSLQKNPIIKMPVTTASIDKRCGLLSATKEKAKIGVLKHFSNDDIVAFTSNYIFPVIKANALYVSRYPIGTSLSMQLITKDIVKIGKQPDIDRPTHDAWGMEIPNLHKNCRGSYRSKRFFAC